MNQLIVDAGGKASDVIDAMIQGLQNIPENFKINMGTYGNSIDEVCYGCAATCAVMRISGKTFAPGNILSSILRSKITGYSEFEEKQFERAIDELRLGNHFLLGYLVGVDLPEPNIPLDELETHNWGKLLPAYEAYRDQLREAGL
jgi:hypothetical protein